MAQRKVVLAVDAAVVLATPVLTGRARSNWIPSLDKPVTKELKKESYDKTGGEAIAAAQSVAAGIKFGSDVYISNNLPYINRLNQGHSQQAPAGFVEKAVQAAKGAIEK
ncbi:hypothetical protein EKK58_10260 [Candidatus Dependentiae bacterium]|nr:MAG: hypothetical protein EKK58_10260 [Candidatus Dependentiae bacterium]